MACLVWGVLGLAGVVLGQSPPRESAITMPRRGMTMPRSFLTDKETGHPRTVWVAYQDYRLRAAADGSEVVARGVAATRFMELFHVAAEHATDGVSYLLLARPAPDRKSFGAPAGWIDAQYVVPRPGAEVDPATNAPRRVIVVNTVRSLQRASEGKLDAVMTRLAPDEKAASGRRIELPSLVFRYGKAGDYVLVGAAPALDAAAKGSESTVWGWVLEEYALGCDSRMAVEWDRASTVAGPGPRRAPAGRVFRSREDAYARSRGDLRPLFEEQADEQGASIGLPPDAPRFPVLPYPADGGPAEVDLDTSNELLRVGALGAFLTAGGLKRTRQEIEGVRSQIDATKLQLARTKQILFVVDDTGSMGKHFGPVARTIEGIVRDATRNDEREVQVAVAFYNDDPGGIPPGYVTMPFRDARTEGERVIADLRAHKVTDGGDFPEMVFRGLEEAVKAAGFGQRANASRLVFLIGDHGDHANPDDPAHTAERRVADILLRTAPDPIELAAVQVVNPDSDFTEYNTEKKRADAKKAAQAFRTQMKTIGRLMNEAPSAQGRTLATYTDLTRSGADLTRVLDLRYDVLKKREEELAGALKRLQAIEYPTKVGPELEQILRERKVPPEQLEEMRGLRVGHDGYVWRWVSGEVPAPGRPGVPQVRLVALYRAGELREFVRLLDTILLAGRPDAEVLAALRAKVGEDRSFQQVFLLPLGLEAHSRLLVRPPKKLGPTLAAEEAGKVRLRRDRLQALLRTAPAGAGRFFHLNGGGELWCWVDVEEELP
jgi:hypothetical protein